MIVLMVVVVRGIRTVRSSVACGVKGATQGINIRNSPHEYALPYLACPAKNEDRRLDEQQPKEPILKQH